ncbi:MAG: 2-phospho-L-lactate guanylyltransferase [Caldilineaceae bacterium]|nr:2-phospho-L-lactate guanylyltransferase [Caldilineaceae bacterium]
MRLWLIVPVKPFDEGKSRLAGTLDAGSRAKMSRLWLTGILTTARASHLFAGILVVSRDQNVLREATALGCQTLVEQTPDLNAALEQARSAVIKAAADALLVLPSDLPLLSRDDLIMLHQQGSLTDGVVIAPSHDGGTNALLLRPPRLIPFAFGPQSFQRHRAHAHAAGYSCAVVRRPSLEFDVDRPEDLQKLAGIGAG